ncbi:uncharacterized protein LOC143300034 [Babylonia areolata]|uniref:uncharacterized protein LOC143300034 n=1 Tax=Babylonia areolata TaxID=304850 RepID=UPI003FD1F1D4
MPHVSMAAILWAFMVCGFGVCPVISQRLQNHSFKAEEVFITDTLCESEQVVDAGTPFGNWKRVLFPVNRTCQGTFRCMINFRYMDSATLATDICADFSRMKVQGHKSVFLMEDETGIDLERLNENRYPEREIYMKTKFCTKKKHTLKLIFRADCNEHLDKKFMGWVYVFVQSTSTGSIYFLDGGARHRHKLPARGPPRITLRSHVWADVPRTSTAQHSMLRLSVHGDNDRMLQSCFKWNPAVKSTVPRGVMYRIFKTYFNQDRVLSTYAEASEGEVVKSPSFYNCHFLRMIQDVVIEVRRDRKVVADGSWDERQLLFDIIVGIDNEDEDEDVVYGPPSPRPGYSTTTAVPEDQESMLEAFWEEHKVIIGACIGGFVFGVLLYCCCKKGSSNGKDDTTNAEDDNMMADTPQNDDGDAVEADSRPREPEAYAMMPRASPSAPSWNEITEDPGGDSAARNMTCNLPTYEDLFPDKK